MKATRELIQTTLDRIAADERAELDRHRRAMAELGNRRRRAQAACPCHTTTRHGGPFRREDFFHRACDVCGAEL